MERRPLGGKSVGQNIKKSRRTVFRFGSFAVVQGNISPLSSRSVLESCVLPILNIGQRTGQ